MQGFAVLIARTNTVVMIPDKASAVCLYRQSPDTHQAVCQAVRGNLTSRAYAIREYHSQTTLSKPRATARGSRQRPSPS